MLGNRRYDGHQVGLTSPIVANDENALVAPRRIFCASLSDEYCASSPDGRGLSAPNIHKRPFNPQTLPRPKLWLQAGTDAVRPNAGEIQKNHPKTPPTTAESSKRCIKRASSPERLDVAGRRVLEIASP